MALRCPPVRANTAGGQLPVPLTSRDRADVSWAWPVGFVPAEVARVTSEDPGTGTKTGCHTTPPLSPGSPWAWWQRGAPLTALSRLADFYHNLCSFLARETDSVLLLVGYRKLPEYHSPIITKDCLNASIHFLKALDTYGVDPARVVLCGESIGGGAVAVTTQSLVGRPDLPRIRAQVLIYPVIQVVNLQLPSFRQNQNVPLLTGKFTARLMCRYMNIHRSWNRALLTGAFIPPEAWSKYKKWLSSDNIPKRFKTKTHQPCFPAPFNEAAYLEMKHLLDVENCPLLAEDEVIAQLPEAFVVSCENDILRDDALLYRKRLEDQGVPVTWHHAEDGFHGSVILFDKKHLSFPCSQEIMNAVVCYIKGI
uniref:Alpha/beta hydrolase fold-3 domain-containing protein n=1 Tax=Oryctolagus cuniculus TaxID=9986 RepID=G1TZQ7_RABIT